MLDRGEGTEESTGGVEGDVDTCLDCILQAASAAPKLAGLALSVVPWDGTDLPLRDRQEGDTSSGEDIDVGGNRNPAELAPYWDTGVVELVRCGARTDAVLLVAGGIFLEVRGGKKIIRAACFHGSSENKLGLLTKDS